MYSTVQVLPCLLCTDEFLPEGEGGKEALLQHLLLRHSFVIADVHLIADFNQYIRKDFSVLEI